MICKSRYNVPESEVGEAWRVHETVHKMQYNKDGILGFLLRYASDYLKGRIVRRLSHADVYRAIRYELEARSIARGR